MTERIDRRQKLAPPAQQLATRELEIFEREYTIEQFPQRTLMLNLGVGFWIVTLVWALAAGRIDSSLDTDLQTTLRYILPFVCLFGALALIICRQFDDQRTSQVVGALAVLSVATQYVLSTYGPGSLGGMYVGLMATIILAAQFVGPRMLAAVLALATAAVLLAAYFNYGNPETHHILSNSVLLIMVYWSMGYASFLISRGRVTALAEAEQVAFSDSLTGLPNSRALRRRTDALLDTRNQRINRRTGVVVLDLDGFRTANMLYGHRDGDRLLLSVAEALSEVAGDAHFLARTGSDEFTLLVGDAYRHDLELLADKSRLAVLEAVDGGPDRGAGIDVSVGWALTHDEGENFDDLMRIADELLYAEKASHERGRRTDSAVPPAPGQPREWRSGPTPEQPAKRNPATFAWSSKSTQTRFNVIGWLLASIGVGLSMLMPDAIAANAFVTEILVTFGLLMSVVYYFKKTSARPIEHFRDVGIASVSLAAAIAATGIGASPVWPVGMLILIYVGWFVELRYVPAIAICSILIVFTPLLWQESTTFAIMDAASLISGVIFAGVLVLILYNDHLHLDRARELTAQLATLDPRAGAYNRRAFEDRIESELEQLNYADRDALAVVMLDLGNFKSVGASLGRTAADQLLSDVAVAITAASRTEDCVARLGGDEFAVVAPGVDAGFARALAQRLIDAVREVLDDFSLPSGEQLRPSAGFALYGMHGRTADELVTAADVALTAAKTAGRDPSRVSSFVVSL